MGHEFAEFCLQLLESLCMQGNADDIEDAVLELGYRGDHAPSVGGEQVAVATLYAGSRPIQSQATQVVAHLTGAYLVWREIRDGLHRLSPIATAEAVQAGQETGQTGRQRHHAGLSEALAGSALPGYGERRGLKHARSA